MKLSSLLPFALAAFVAATPVPQSSPVATCTAPLVRKEWRTLTAAEKVHFLNAVQCLHDSTGLLQSEPTYSVPGAKTRFEDFVAEHQKQTNAVHFVGHFLIWHRNLLSFYEQTLRSECGYTGALPYWDGSLDVGALASSPVFDTTLGFGGNGAFNPAAPDHAPPFGTAGGGCITTGPFSGANFGIHLGKGTDTSEQVPPRCLTRNFKPVVTDMWLTSAREAAVLAHTSFETFHVALEGNMNLFVDVGIHNGAHFGVGGDMNDMYIANADPLFYLVHANIDRIWATWQAADPSRKFDVGGPIGPRIPQLAPVGIPAGNVTLDFVTDLGKLGGTARTVKAAQVADTKGLGLDPLGKGNGILCYEYA